LNIYRLIYKSKPFGYDQATLNGILSDAINYNSKNNITGALICRDDIYLQLLEGPENEVNLTFEKISNDDRHLEIELLLKEYCNKRIFPGWHMKDDPARTWFWNKEEVNSGIFNKISQIKIVEVFEKIANQIK
tara:strand:+ start:163 stop:561 length:399 start_codon:yes stop_codon:yes gene_type:complete